MAGLTELNWKCLRGASFLSLTSVTVVGIVVSSRRTGRVPAMSGNAQGSKQASYLDAVLEGGPADIPATERYRQVSAGEIKVKVPHQGGYEHFERTGEQLNGTDGHLRSIYRWVTRTRVAE
jgi:hypothetical protein